MNYRETEALLNVQILAANNNKRKGFGIWWKWFSPRNLIWNFKMSVIIFISWYDLMEKGN